MKAGFYQFDVIFGKKEDNLGKVAAALRDADADLIVLPEFFATGYQFATQEEVVDLAEPVPVGMTTDFLIEQSRQRGIYLVAGLPERDGEAFFNSAVLTGPDGFIGLYRKTHLFSREKLFFAPGDTGFRVWETEIGRIGVMICFDWFFPESMRTLALRGAEVIAHPSNLVLPYCPQAMPTRCLENRVFAVTANRTGTEARTADETLTFIGQSQITSPKAEVIVRAPGDGASLLIAEIDPSIARNKALNPLNDLFADRRPDLYER
ncbi:MAG TPA: nitrilase-related carbon-nitrogen hydrolase [Dissulfurispiraceae bacterium]|nr:nitrilase-related carbon-nitrogen hydrolase [Dissulfurispiraceae bacterium]